MKSKKIFAVLMLAGVMLGCSSPQKIVLKDNTVIETDDKVEFDRKTGFYKYEDQEGNESQVNSVEVKLIEEK